MAATKGASNGSPVLGRTVGAAAAAVVEERLTEGLTVDDALPVAAGGSVGAIVVEVADVDEVLDRVVVAVTDVEVVDPPAVWTSNGAENTFGAEKSF